MSSVIFSDNARWIWSSDTPHTANSYVCFRRTFTVNLPLQSSRVLITADARYELFVNGEWLGHGPARSWTSPWPVEEYDITRLLQPGDNVMAVMVQDIGVSTFQYILGAPGLIAETEIHDQKGHRNFVTNGSWKCSANQGYNWPVPRIDCQQGWEEQFDARTSHGIHDWKQLQYDDSDWEEADVRGRAGEPPHPEFEMRAIPKLTRTEVPPSRLVQVDAVRPADYTWHLAPRRLLNPNDHTANRIRGKLMVMSYIHSPEDQTIKLQSMGSADWKLNGHRLRFSDQSSHHSQHGVTQAELDEGWNLLLSTQPGEHTCETHALWASINIWAEEELTFTARPELESEHAPWLALGPFTLDDDRVDTAMGEFIEADHIHDDATSACYHRIWDDGQPDKSVLSSPYARELGPDMYTDVDVYAITTSDQCSKNGQISLEDEAALLNSNEDWTTIHPPDNGDDVRLLLDFGDEVVGYHEFEVDAPDGTIIDNQNFEFIQRDGRYNLAEGMNNSFRYVCREGIQRYRTFVRRGFRYSWIVLRNFDRPIRIRFIRAISSTYPVEANGDFEASDYMLGPLWDMGFKTLECCSEDAYTDCPTYEQTHWVGDARHEALIDLLSTGDPRLSEHCWTQAARSLDRSPLVECHVPSGWQCILTAWSLLWMRWAEEHFMLTGDEELACEMLRYIERNICGLEQHVNEDNLLEINAWNMLDWADMDTPNNGVVTHQNCLSVLALKQVANMANHTGQKGRAKRWEALADRMSDAINEHLWSQRDRAYIDCIHADGSRSNVLSEQTQCMAYLADIPSGDRAERCLDVVLAPPDNFVTAGSPFYMFFALEAMAKAGRYDALLNRMRNYWKPQVDAGATTLWESYHPEKDRKTRSHCHAWSGAPTYFLPREILGIKPADPGYDSVLISPHPCDLAWAHGRVPTPHGTINCHWENDDAMFRLDVRLPENMGGQIHLPWEGALNIETGDTTTLAAPDDEIHIEFVGPRVTLTLNRSAS